LVAAAFRDARDAGQSIRDARPSIDRARHKTRQVDRPGLYSDPQLLLLALVSAPAMVIGLYAGHRVTLRMSREQFLRILHLLLIGTGMALVVRGTL
jgi:hypothetical protein